MSSVYPPESNRIKYIHRHLRRLELKEQREKEKRQFGFKKKGRGVKIKFDSDINLIKKPNKTLGYFNSAHRHYQKNKDVDYDLSKVNKFSPESIAVFAAIIGDRRFTNGMNSTGNMPKSIYVARAFRDSGFFDHVDVSGSKNRYRQSKGKLLHKITNNKVETDLASETCLRIMDKVGAKYIDDLEPLYDVLIEVMQNTNNHASNDDENEYDWWLYTYEDKNDGKLYFTFLDIGVGVFESLSVMNWRKRLLNSANFSSNIDLVEDLFAGKIKSRTKRRDRGKGIPQIYDCSKDGMFEEFYMIANDVMVDMKNDVRTKLDEKFSGTLYYWTMNINQN